MFEDVRESKAIGSSGLFGIFKYKTKDNLSEIVSKTFVDVLRRNNINAKMCETLENDLCKNKLLVRGEITDFFFRHPWTSPLFRSPFKIGVGITIEDVDGKELITKKYLKKFKLPRSKTISRGLSNPPDGYPPITFDIELRSLFQQIVDDDEFKGAISAELDEGGVVEE